MDNFEIICKLGTGGFSKVYKVRRKEDNLIYALKKVQILNLSEKQQQNSLNEIRVLASIKNKYILQYKEAFLDPKDSTLCLVMEYADKGDLENRIKEQKKRGKYFNERDIWRIFIQLIKGLKSLHDLNIMHRDIKSSNIFLFSDGTAKLGDLNVCKILSDENNLAKTQAGTPSFAAPEVWMEKPYGLKSDIWSLGCVLYEIVTLKCPFNSNNVVELYNKILVGEFNKIPKKFSKDLSYVIENMIKYEPEKRISCENILKYENKLLNKKENDIIEDDIIINEEKKLLDTIYIPNNIIYLNNQLPKANYSQEIKYSSRKNNLKPIKIKSDLNSLSLSQNNRKHNTNHFNINNQKNFNYNKFNSDGKIHLSNIKRYSQESNITKDLTSFFNKEKDNNIDSFENNNKIKEIDINKSAKCLNGPIKLKKLHSDKSLIKILNSNKEYFSDNTLNNKININININNFSINNIKIKEKEKEKKLFYEKQINDLNSLKLIEKEIKNHYIFENDKLKEILYKKKKRKSHGHKKDIKFILKVKNDIDNKIDNKRYDNIDINNKDNDNNNKENKDIINEYKPISTEINISTNNDNDDNNDSNKFNKKSELSPIKQSFNVNSKISTSYKCIKKLKNKNNFMTNFTKNNTDSILPVLKSSSCKKKDNYEE